MRRTRKDALREGKTGLFVSWALALTAAVLPLIYAPVARDPNLAKPVLFVAALIVITAFLFAQVRRAETLRPRVNVLDVCVVLYLLLTCASWVYCEFRYAAAAAIRPALACGILYAIARASLKSEPQRLRVVKGVLIGCAIVSILAILEEAGKQPWVRSSHAYGVAGTWFNRTYLAAYLLLLLPVAVWAAWAKTGATRLLGWVTLLLGMPSLAFTGARIGVVALFPMAAPALIGMWPLLAERRRRQLATAIAVLMVFGIALGVATRHQIARKLCRPEGMRITMMQSALRVGVARPVIGFGAGTYGIYAPEKIPRRYYEGMSHTNAIWASVVIVNAHNEFLQVFAELGAVGVMAYLAIPVVAAWQVRKSRLRKEVPASVKTLGVALVTGIVGFLSANLVDPSARVPGMCSFYYLFLAIIGSAFWPALEANVPAELSRSVRGKVAALLGTTCVALVVIGWAAIADLRSTIYLVRGETLLTSATDTAGAEAAVEEFRRACVVTPKNPAAQYDLANALAVSGRHKEALRVYKIVEALSPDYGRLHFNQGTSLYHLRRYREAEREMALAYRLDNLPDSRVRLQCLRELLKTAGSSPRPAP